MAPGFDFFISHLTISGYLYTKKKLTHVQNSISLIILWKFVCFPHCSISSIVLSTIKAQRHCCVQSRLTSFSLQLDKKTPDCQIWMVLLHCTSLWNLLGSYELGLPHPMVYTDGLWKFSIFRSFPCLSTIN